MPTPDKKNFWPLFKAPLKKMSLIETRFVYFCTILFIFPGKCQAFHGRSQDSWLVYSSNPLLLFEHCIVQKTIVFCYSSTVFF